MSVQCRWLLGLLVGCSTPWESSVVGGCSNGIDDDGNGWFDCDDPTCVRAPDCAIEAMDTGLAGAAGSGTSAVPTTESSDATGDADTGSDKAPAESDTSDPACNTNSMRVLLPDGQGSADFDAFVWVADGEELVVAGLQTGGVDGCDAVTDIEGQPGYLLEVDIVGVPASGDQYSVVFDANDPLQAEVRFENLGTSIAEVSTGEGGLTIESFSEDGTLEVSGFTATLNGGSTILDGSFVACKCNRVPE